jgi:hypothetical protein
MRSNKRRSIHLGEEPDRNETARRNNPLRSVSIFSEKSGQVLTWCCGKKAMQEMRRSRQRLVQKDLEMVKVEHDQSRDFAICYYLCESRNS